MINQIFLICALSLPGSGFTRPPIVSYKVAQSEQEIADLIKRHNPDIEEVLIHEMPVADKMKERFWEKLPFNYKDGKLIKEIWIRRKPRIDHVKKRALDVSA